MNLDFYGIGEDSVLSRHSLRYSLEPKAGHASPTIPAGFMKASFVVLERRSRVCLLLLPLVLSAGCSGINATKSISPLDFILPGLMRIDPPPPVLPPGTNTLVYWQNDLR